jgi:hypothetical protein
VTDERLTLRLAAARLGVSESAIRKRVERGTLRSEKGSDGKRYVYLDTGADGMADAVADVSATHESSLLISELRAHIGTLQAQLEQANERDRENRRIIAALTSRIPAIEPPESPESVTEMPMGPTPSETREEAQEGAERRSWWRRVFGS